MGASYSTGRESRSWTT